MPEPPPTVPRLARGDAAARDRSARRVRRITVTGGVGAIATAGALTASLAGSAHASTAHTSPAGTTTDSGTTTTPDPAVPPSLQVDPGTTSDQSGGFSGPPLGGRPGGGGGPVAGSGGS
jgi:hypothetical protein